MFFIDSCSSDKESIEEIQGKVVETSEKDEGEVRASEEESEINGELQGDIRPSEEEEEMKREVQEKDGEITYKRPAEADIEYQVQSTHEQDNYPSLMALPFPTDPAHVEQLKIKLNSTYIQFCCSLGPCQPVAGFPKNPQGWSFQSQWYAGNNWLEYSVVKDAMYCFNCHLFLTEDKFKARTAWRTTGVVNWRKDVEKIHEHAATEAHMISMVRWANYRKGPLVEAFKAQDAECELQNEKDRRTEKSCFA